MIATLLIAALAGTTGSARQDDALSPASVAQLGLPDFTETVSIDGASPLVVTITSRGTSAAVARLRETSTRALRLFSQWLGPLEAGALTVIDLPWNAEAPSAAYPQLAATRVRWLTPPRDVVAERALIVALARQFWFGTAGDPSFREALTIYTATRGIHADLEGRNFAVPRFLGGFVPFPLRSLLLSPSPAGERPTLREFDEVVQPAEAPWRFAPAGPGSNADHMALALRAFERVIGWPAMQQALAATRARAAAEPLSPELFAAVVAEQRGQPVDWFVRDLMRSRDPIDYAVSGFTSEPGPQGMRTIVSIERRGPGVFVGTDRPGAAGTARSFPLQVLFEDGSTASAFVDGREARTEIVFDGAARAVTAMIDPDDVMLVDKDRSNNRRHLGAVPADRTGLRLVMNWMIWLQNVVLTYTAVA